MSQVPPEVLGAVAPGLTPNALGTVGDMGGAILKGLPPEAQAVVTPFITDIVDAIYRAFSIATAATFVPGIITALIAAGLVLLLRDPDRRTTPVEGGHPVIIGG